MKRIGLTGGIGSGKSTVARMLAERGAVVVDADQIARELVEPGGAALAELVTEFGPRILQADGSLSRAELAAMAFSDPRATERLNAIMHPLIGAEAQRRINDEPQAAVVVYDMPLLVETGQARPRRPGGRRRRPRGGAARPSGPPARPGRGRRAPAHERAGVAGRPAGPRPTWSSTTPAACAQTHEQVDQLWDRLTVSEASNTVDG